MALLGVVSMAAAHPENTPCLAATTNRTRAKLGTNKFIQVVAAVGIQGKAAVGSTVPGRERVTPPLLATVSPTTPFPVLVLPKEMETPLCLPCLLHQRLVAMRMVTPTVTKAIRQKFSEAQLTEPGKRKDLY
jgi:hypothetical protein